MIRNEFPLLSSCTYLNSNSTGAMPRGVQDVLSSYWETMTTWRDEAWGSWLDQMESYRTALAAFIGAPAGTVVTDANVTTLLGRLASCFDFTSPRNRVVTSDLEFPTVPFLWRGFSRYGASLVVAGNGGPAYDVSALVSSIDSSTRLVCVSHGSYTTGAVLSLEPIIERAHSVGALVVVDAYQTVGVVPLDVVAMGADFVLGGANKWMCGTNTAFLYVRQDLLATLRPAVTGWFASDSPLSFTKSSDWAADAQRLAGGTPLPLTTMMSRVGLDLLASVGVSAIRDHSLRCTDRIISRAADAGIPVITPVASRGGVVVLSLPASVHSALESRNMICSWRGGLRVAPHIYNTLDEVDAFMDAVVELS